MVVVNCKMVLCRGICYTSNMLADLHFVASSSLLLLLNDINYVNDNILHSIASIIPNKSTKRIVLVEVCAFKYNTITYATYYYCISCRLGKYW